MNDERRGTHYVALVRLPIWKKHMRKQFVFLLALAAAGCEDRVIGPERSDADAIQVAYFAELMAEEPFPAGTAYCVSTGTWAERQDPSQDVLSDLRRVFGKVQPASACVSDNSGSTYNAEPARSYHIDSVAQQGIVATVVGFYRQNALEGAYYTAHLEKQETFWVITDFEMTGVW